MTFPLGSPGFPPRLRLDEILPMLAELKRARESGARSIKFGEREVSYRSDAELVAAIAALQAELDALDGTDRVRNIVVRPTFNKGW